MSCRSWIVPFALVLAVFAAYGNALHGAFQFDDFRAIVNQDAVHSWTAWQADLGQGLRPLLKLSYVLSWLSGMDAPGFHLFNIGVHIVTTLLVYFVALRLIGPQRGKQGMAFLAALLFAVHPVNTEAITYISGRSMSLMTLFYLASMLAYIKGREENRARLVFVVSPLLFILAVAGKETAVTLPFALLLWEVCFSRAGSIRDIIRRQAVHWCVFLLLASLLLFNDRYWQLMAFSAGLHTVQENLLTQLHALTYLLGQLLFPWRSNIDPDLPVIGTWLEAWPDVLLWLALAMTALANIRRRPWLSFALGWFILQLLPLYVFLPRLDIANDRQLYLAGWPMLLLPATVCSGMMANRAMRYATAAALVLVLAGLTMARNEVYRSEAALWEDTVRNSPHKARPYNNLGYAYQLAGDRLRAEQAYRTAISLDPGYWRAGNNLARLSVAEE